MMFSLFNRRFEISEISEQSPHSDKRSVKKAKTVGLKNRQQQLIHEQMQQQQQQQEAIEESRELSSYELELQEEEKIR